MNKYKGEFDIILGGKPHTLVYDWEAIAAMKSIHPDENVISTLYADKDTHLLSKIVAIGLKKYHPDMTAEQVFKLSPAVIPTIQKVDQALLIAYVGPDEPKKSDDSKKKVSGLKTRLRNLLN